MKNETIYIKSAANRILTAKAYFFINRCVHIIADQHNTSKYDPQMKPLKEKLNKIMHHLFIDKGLTIKEIKELIKNRTLFIK